MRQLLFAVAIACAPVAMAQTPVAATRDCETCPELAVVPPGQFAMGSAPDAVELDATTGETPAVGVSFTRPFLISRREITVGEFRRYAELLKAFWEGLGSNVECMDADHHDLVLAITSHVPHLIAYNIVNTAAHLERVTDSEVIKFSAGGFRDFTRIAASDPTMWRDVFLNNKEAVLEMLARFSEDLSALQRAIRFGDGDTLFRLFTEARAIRRGIIQAGQDTAAPDFGRRATPKADDPPNPSKG